VSQLWILKGRTIWIADAHRDNGQRFIVRPGLPGAPDPLGPPNGRDGSNDDDDGGRRSTECRSSRRSPSSRRRDSRSGRSRSGSHHRGRRSRRRSCTETTSRMDIARMRLPSPQRRKLRKT
jgi:hypothetical protein